MSCVTQIKRRVPPPLSRAAQQRRPSLALESAERLVEDREARRRASECAAEPHALSFSAGEERAPFAERRLQPVWQVRDERAEVGVRHAGADRQAGRADPPEVEVVGQRSVPQLHAGIDPRRFTAQTIQPRPLEAFAIDHDLAGRRPVPSEQQAHERRLPGARRADDRDVRARRDRQRGLFENRLAAGANA